MKEFLIEFDERVCDWIIRRPRATYILAVLAFFIGLSL